MSADMNGYIIETTIPNEDMPRGEAVRWIGISPSAKAMIALLDGHSPSVVDRSHAVLLRAQFMGLRNGEVRQIDV